MKRKILSTETIDDGKEEKQPFTEVKKEAKSFDTNILIDNISNTLKRVIEANIKEQKPENKSNILEYKKVPNITILAYIKHLVKYSIYFYDAMHYAIHDEINAMLISSLIYMNRYIQSQDCVLNDKNVHLLFLICFSVSIKFNLDCYPNNEFLARLGGIMQNGKTDTEKFNKMEVAFLMGVGFDLYVKSTTYDEYSEFLMPQQVVKEESDESLTKSRRLIF